MALSHRIHRLPEGLCLDARHALWLPAARTLAVADLHLGYFWAHRHAGNLMPLSAPDDTIDRLEALVREYGAEQLILLGDIVHRAVPVVELRAELAALAARLASVAVRWVAGNHDRRLQELLNTSGLERIRLETEVALGAHLFLHGDEKEAAAADRIRARLGEAGWLIMGHEHPAIHVGDGHTSSVKCPCFLRGPNILVLPAFSPWSAGSNIRAGGFLSVFAQDAVFTHAHAILSGRLLPIPL